jgi:hypothetical protein
MKTAEKMSFVVQALNLTCLVLVAMSVGIFWTNRELESEIIQLNLDAESLKVQLEKIHKTCKDKVVGAFPRIPATHIVTHSDAEAKGLDAGKNVTFIVLYLADSKHSWSCIKNQVNSIKGAFPEAKILQSVVSTNTDNIKLVLGVKTVGIFHSRAEALNMAIKEVKTPYFMVMQPEFIIEPKGSDTGVEWLHHALVVTPGVDIIGGSVLLSNNELVVPCYSLNFCNWTMTQKYEYKRSFGEIMICDEASHSFMARKDIIAQFKDELFDKSLQDEGYMFIDFFLRAKNLDLTTANRPEVLFVQQNLCAPQKISSAANMENAIPFARKYQIMQFKNPENKLYNICEASRSTNICTTENVLKEFKFPNWYEDGMFAYPFVIKQAIQTLEVVSDQLRKADINFSLRGETLYGAVMTKSVLPWGRLNSIQLTVFDTKTTVTKFASANRYVHKISGDIITLTVQVPNFLAPMKVEINMQSSDNVKFVNIRVNGKLYPAPFDPIAQLKKEYGENFLQGEDGKTESDFSCKVEKHHACMPAMHSRGASTYQENYCEI